MLLYIFLKTHGTRKHPHLKRDIFLLTQVLHKMIGVIHIQITHCKNISFAHPRPPRYSSNTLPKIGIVKWIFSGLFPGTRYGGSDRSVHARCTY